MHVFFVIMLSGQSRFPLCVLFWNQSKSVMLKQAIRTRFKSLPDSSSMLVKDIHYCKELLENVLPLASSNSLL